MPGNIRTFTSPIDQLHPSDKGIEAWQMEGRRVGEAYHQLGEYAGRTVNEIGDLEDQAYASKIANDYSSTFAEMSKSWNETAKNADPNDPDTADKWRQNVLEPALEKLGADAPTKKSGEVANRYANSLRNHFTDVTIADQSRLAGTATEGNITEAMNNLTSSVTADPTQMDMALASVKAITDAQIQAHALNASDTDTIRKGMFAHQRQVVVAGVEAAAKVNPKYAHSLLDSGRYDNYITGPEKEFLGSYIDSQDRLQQSQARLNKAQAVKEESLAVDGKLSDLAIGGLQADGTQKLPANYYQTIQELRKQYPDVPGSKFQAAVNLGQRIEREAVTKKNAVSDPNTYQGFADRLTLDEDDPNHIDVSELIDARAQGLLSSKDYAFMMGSLRAQASDPDYKSARGEYREFIKGIKSSITRSNIFTGANDPGGDQRYLQFTQTADAQFEKAYKDGTWRQLLDRSNKSGLWAQSVRFQVSPDQTLTELNNSTEHPVGLVPQVGGGPPKPAPGHPQPGGFAKRNPGESIKDHDRRTGGH